MFRKGRQTPATPPQQSSTPSGLGGEGTPEHQTIREEPMLDRDRSVAPSSDGGGGTFLGTDVEFKGSLKFKDQLRINGRFEGELSSSGTVHVGPQGDVKAEIAVGNAVVEGAVDGNITATERVELRSTARMMGDITASKLVVEEGVVFVGRCEVSSDRASTAPKKRKAEPEPEQPEIEIGLGV
jgi:cytoskeletal protein CcmA (bactofilin family)